MKEWEIHLIESTWSNSMRIVYCRSPIEDHCRGIELQSWMQTVLLELRWSPLCHSTLTKPFVNLINSLDTFEQAALLQIASRIGSLRITKQIYLILTPNSLMRLAGREWAPEESSDLNFTEVIEIESPIKIWVPIVSSGSNESSGFRKRFIYALKSIENRSKISLTSII